MYCTFDKIGQNNTFYCLVVVLFFSVIEINGSGEKINSGFGDCIDPTLNQSLACED